VLCFCPFIALSLLIFTCAHRSLALCFALRFICIAISVSDNITIVTALCAPRSFFLRFSRWAILCLRCSVSFHNDFTISLLLHGNSSQCCFNFISPQYCFLVCRTTSGVELAGSSVSLKYPPIILIKKKY
jgi:hypothetical protein